VDIGSSVNNITYECLQKLKPLGKAMVPLVHPILGFEGQKFNPIGTVRLPLRFGDLARPRNIEVDFLTMDVPIAYNIILG